MCTMICSGMPFGIWYFTIFASFPIYCSVVFGVQVMDFDKILSLTSLGVLGNSKYFCNDGDPKSNFSIL